MRNHSKSQKNIKRHGNETRITQKIEKNRIIKNQKETSEDNRQNPPLDLILLEFSEVYKNFATVRWPETILFLVQMWAYIIHHF